MTKYIFFAGGMEEGNRAMKLRSTAVMSTSALGWRSSCPVLAEAYKLAALDGLNKL
jgi:hypothetical protein